MRWPASSTASIRTLPPPRSAAACRLHLFDQLVREPSPGSFVPGLAEKWDVNPAADEYTFYLRKDVKFHDGTPFNAEAVKYTFDRIVNPDMKSQLALSLIGPYDSTTVVDPFTVKVKFKPAMRHSWTRRHSRSFRSCSPTATEKFGKDIAANPAGTGPYKFESYQTDNVSGWSRTGYDWAPAFFKHQGAPFIDAIIFRIIADPATRVAALKSGEVHVIEDLPSPTTRRCRGTTTIRLSRRNRRVRLFDDA